MQVPSTSALAPELGRAARTVALRLKEAGHRGWIVGGAVRDLALGRPVPDLDMVSAARPEEVEALFERSFGVGRAFGIVVVLIEGAEVELATLRRERGYSDARRPDEVQYTSSVEEDALRRDFTCNALYLDPLTDEVRDPAGGVGDLQAGLLRTVGDPRARFAEDGLRLLRMARFEGALAMEPAAGLHEAARAARSALSGVSPERVLDELTKVCKGPGAAIAVEAALDCGLLETALPGYRPGPDARRSVFRHLPDPPGTALGLAALLESEPLDRAGGNRAGASFRLLDALHPSRALSERVAALWDLRAELPALLAPDCKRSRRIRALREEVGADGLVLEAAWRRASGATTEALSSVEELSAWRAGLDGAQRRPRPLLTPADLAAAGLERGPLWGELLGEAEDAQLDGEYASRDGALAWLARRLEA